jgi:hypothetical protein
MAGLLASDTSSRSIEEKQALDNEFETILLDDGPLPDIDSEVMEAVQAAAEKTVEEASVSTLHPTLDNAFLYSVLLSAFLVVFFVLKLSDKADNSLRNRP